jgi:hypothetical protein
MREPSWRECMPWLALAIKPSTLRIQPGPDSVGVPMSRPPDSNNGGGASSDASLHELATHNATTQGEEKAASGRAIPIVARPSLPRTLDMGALYEAAQQVEAPAAETACAVGDPIAAFGGLPPLQGPTDLQAAVSGLGLPPVVGSHDDPDAPQLPLSPDEPPPVSAIDPGMMQPDLGALAGLQRLAGQAADPQRCYQHLLAALNGAAYDPRSLPEARPMLLGMARILVRSGVPAEALAQAIVDAMLE